MFEQTASRAEMRTSGWTRGAMLLAAGIASLALMLDPYVLRGISQPRVHAGLPLLLLSVCGAYVYGLGFRPTNVIPRAAIHPFIVLSVFVAGVVVLFAG